jgi:hypothetical protein
LNNRVVVFVAMDNESIRTVSCGLEVFNMDLVTLLLLTGAIALLYYYLVGEAGKIVDGKIYPPGKLYFNLFFLLINFTQSSSLFRSKLLK